MPVLLAAALALSAGLVVGIQPALYGSIQEVIGPWRTAVLGFVIGSVLALPLLVFGSPPTSWFAHTPRWYYLVAPATGVYIVTIGAVTVRPLGATAYTAFLIAGLLTTAVVADLVGFAGLAKVPLSVERIVGLALLAAGAWLVLQK